MTHVIGKTFLSRRGYAVLKKHNDTLIEQLKEELTVKPLTHPDMPGADEIVPFPVYRESSKKLYLPKFYGLQRFGPATENTLDNGVTTTLEFNGQLRDEQRVPAQNFIDAVQDPSRQGGILSLFCGGGKTVLALYLTAFFKKKTLIVVHKEFLLNQWKEEIEHFLPKARVGLIKQSKIQVENKDIVLASLQSLAMRDYPDTLFQDFGMVIIDECHHMGAEVFSRALPKITCRIMLGLSATLDRNDGMSKIFYWYLGKPVFQQKKRADTGTTVVMHSYYNPHPDYGRELSFHKNGRKVLKIPNMISAIASFEPRNDEIMDILKAILDKEPGRQVIILSERISQLRTLEHKIQQCTLGTTGYYIGGMPPTELDKSAKCKIILASYQMSSEGMNIPTLNTLILASPISSVEQSIGRIQRQKASERQYRPLVVDVWDRFSRFQTQGLTRIKHYKAQGYDIVYEGQTYGNEPMEPSNTNTNKSSTPSQKTVLYRDEDEY
jgi:superfamily II DNA or RNA helicase